VSDLALLLIVILGAVVIWRGPKVLPRLGAMAGRGVREAREAAGRQFGGDDDSEEHPAR
jgi:Sec-independent protein translocase protein TatA